MWKLKPPKAEKKIIATFSVLIVLFLDQFSKGAADNYFTTVCNKGIAFGFGNNVTLLVLLVLVLVLWIWKGQKGVTANFGFSLIFAGGLSNFADRMFYGCVRDFITLGKFPSFNLADVIITIGAFILLVGATKRNNEN